MLLRWLCRMWNRRPASPRTGAGGAAQARTEAPPPQPEAPAAPEELHTLLDIPGIGPKTVQYLAEGGYTTLAQVRAASESELAAVDGVGPRAAAALKSALSQ